jgi:hypothetical protein
MKVVGKRHTLRKSTDFGNSDTGCDDGESDEKPPSDASLFILIGEWSSVIFRILPEPLARTVREAKCDLRVVERQPGCVFDDDHAGVARRRPRKCGFVARVTMNHKYWR